MIEFTKEELEDMHLVYKTFCVDDGIQRDLTTLEKSILDKIQTLIDSMNNESCKHVDNGMFYYTNPPKYCCKKCGEFYL